MGACAAYNSPLDADNCILTDAHGEAGKGLLAWSVSKLTRGGCCAGLYVYLMSSWTPSKKADFYQYHRYLGLATYIAGLVAGARGSRPHACVVSPLPQHCLHSREGLPVMSCPACVSSYTSGKQFS